MLTKSAAAVLLAGYLAVTPMAYAAETWDLWEAYGSAFIKDGRVVDHQGGDRTTSEGQAYGMFFALVANDRTRFDRLLAWTATNLAHGDLSAHLPAWEWGRTGDGRWEVLDPNSAADADLWIGYTLGEAGRLWKEPRYEALGRALVARIAKQEVTDIPGIGPVLLPGQVGFHPSAKVWLLNPSYTPLPVVARLAQVDPKGPWAGMARSLPRVVAQSPAKGFAMDWVSYSLQNGFVAAASPGGGEASGAMGSYDAIRVYLWAGMTDPRTPGRDAMLRAVPGMAVYLDSHSYPPEQVNAKGVVVGAKGGVGFSAAVIPYLDALGKGPMRDRQEGRLAGEADPVTKLYGHPAAYYDQNLVLFAEGWQQHRFRFGPDGELEVRWK